MTKIRTVDVPISICEPPDINRDDMMEGGGEFVLEFPDVVYALVNQLELPDDFLDNSYLHATLQQWKETGTITFEFRPRGQV